MKVGISLLLDITVSLKVQSIIYHVVAENILLFYVIMRMDFYPNVKQVECRKSGKLNMTIKIQLPD